MAGTMRCRPRTRDFRRMSGNERSFIPGHAPEVTGAWPTSHSSCHLQQAGNLPTAAKTTAGWFQPEAGTRKAERLGADRLEPCRAGVDACQRQRAFEPGEGASQRPVVEVVRQRRVVAVVELHR